jgi:hypothetical protein
VRILYTEAFFPKEFTGLPSAKTSIECNKQLDNDSEKPKAELEKGIMLSLLAKSEHGTLFS